MIWIKLPETWKTDPKTRHSSKKFKKVGHSEAATRILESMVVGPLAVPKGGNKVGPDDGSGGSGGGGGCCVIA